MTFLRKPDKCRKQAIAPMVTWPNRGTGISIRNVASKTFTPLLLISFALAILVFVTPWVVGNVDTKATTTIITFLVFLWIAIVLYAFIRLKKRGLWFLLGTPFILFWFFVPPT